MVMAGRRLKAFPISVIKEMRNVRGQRISELSRPAFGGDGGGHRAAGPGPDRRVRLYFRAAIYFLCG